MPSAIELADTIFERDEDRPQLDVIQEALHTVRTHFGMEMAYLSEIVGDEWVVRACDAPGLEALIKPGDRLPLSAVYCDKVASGALPELMPDTADFPLTASIPTAKEVPIRAHVSVAIKRQDGSHFGNFCCLSPTPNPSLNTRDLEMMRIFARLAQREVQGVLETRSKTEIARSRITQVMAEKAFSLVFQPLCDLPTRDVIGFEALCRFPGEPKRGPDKWFAEAAEVGLGPELEYCVLETALEALGAIPEPFYLSVNAGPELVATGRLTRLFSRHDAKRIVLEVTEQTEVPDEEAVDWALAELRNQGARVAMDDAGAGYSGLQRLIRLKPDLIKMDRSLVTDIHLDPARRALCAAMTHYAYETKALLVAEGIETEEEALALIGLGVQIGQGWHLGRPVPLDEALRAAGQPVCPLMDTG